MSSTATSIPCAALYAQVTDKSREIVEHYEHRANVKTFTSQIDGKAWYDIPFAYEPWWEARRAIQPSRSPGG